MPCFERIESIQVRGYTQFFFGLDGFSSTPTLYSPMHICLPLQGDMNFYFVELPSPKKRYNGSGEVENTSMVFLTYM